MQPETNVRRIKTQLGKEGWEQDDGKGSHAVYKKNGKHISVPVGHKGELPIGTAMQIAKKAGWR